MNLSTMMLRIYLKNPTVRARLNDHPVIVLPNDRRIVVETIEYDVTSIDDPRRRSVVASYRLHRELGTRGEHQTLIGEFHSLEDVSKIIEQETHAPKEPRSVRFRSR